MDTPHCSKSELDLFANNPVQVSVLSDNIVTIKPVSVLDTKGQLEFYYGGGGADVYVDLSQTYLRLKLSITKSGMTGTVDEYETGFINNILFSLFSQCEVYLNEVNITAMSSDYYHYKTYIQSLLNYSHDAANTHLATAGFFLDTGSPPTATDNNTGFKSRLAPFKGGKDVVLHSRLHGDIFDQPKLLPAGTEIRIRLVFADRDFYLWDPDATSSTEVKLKDASLYIRQVQVNPSVVIAHQRVFEKRNAVYPMKRTECKSYSIPQNSKNFNIHNFFTGVLPDKIYVAFITSKSFGGSLDTNPFTFIHKDITGITLVENGVERKIDDFSFDTDGNYNSAYSTLFEGTGIHRLNTGHLITYTMYKNGYCLFCWDLTPDRSGHIAHTSIKKMGNIRLYGQFKTQITEPIICLVYAEFSVAMELDKYRKPKIYGA